MQPQERDGQAAEVGRRARREATGLEQVASGLHRSFQRARREQTRGARAVRLWKRLVPLESMLLGHRLPHPLQLVAHASWRRDGLDRFCWRCGVTRAPFECLDGGCAECRGRPSQLDGMVRLGAYAPPLTQWVPAVKSRAWRAMGEFLGRELGAQVLEAVLAGRMRAPDLVVPVPSHPLRSLARGIAHSEVLAAQAAVVLGCPVASVLSISLTTRQARASRGLRRRNVNRFHVRKPPWSRWPWTLALSVWDCLAMTEARDDAGGLSGRSILLIDDVRTTGRTLDDAARVLRLAGAAHVVGGAGAVADPPHRNALRGR